MLKYCFSGGEGGQTPQPKLVWTLFIFKAKTNVKKLPKLRAGVIWTIPKRKGAPGDDVLLHPNGHLRFSCVTCERKTCFVFWSLFTSV